MDKLNIYFSNGKTIAGKRSMECKRNLWVRFQSFSMSASLARERLKSYLRVSEMPLYCTPPVLDYIYLVLGRDTCYCVENHPGSSKNV